MTKKLLHKTSKVYLLFSAVLLIVSAPLFYYITERLYIEETDETLILHKNEFLKYSKIYDLIDHYIIIKGKLLLSFICIINQCKVLLFIDDVKCNDFVCAYVADYISGFVC